jgi:phosphoserine aminotransferase
MLSRFAKTLGTINANRGCNSSIRLCSSIPPRAKQLSRPSQYPEVAPKAVPKVRVIPQTERVYNFSAGPACIPGEVMAIAQRDLMNYKQSGMGFMEMSHRDANGPVHQVMMGAVSDLRSLLKIPENYQVLFFQGGAHAQFAGVPLNIAGSSVDGRRPVVDVISTGAWSERAIGEMEKYVDVNIAYDAAADNYSTIAPVSEWNLSPDSKYVHITGNETMHGLEFLEDPDLGDRILVADMTSTLLSRPMDISKYGVIYASSGKNLGPAGLCVAIVRDDLIGLHVDTCPSVIQYESMAFSHPIPNIYNTPPTFLVYMMHLMTQHYRGKYGSLEILAERAKFRADKVYQVIDSSDGFYRNEVEDQYRSRMNCTFRILDGDRSLEKKFTEDAERNGILQLFGHPMMGGLRITLYNGIPDEAVDAVVGFMQKFKKAHS